MTSHEALTVTARDGAGELAVSRHYPEVPGDGRGWITIDRADQRILIPGDTVLTIARGECQPYAKICTLSQGDGFGDGKLEIRAENRNVIYALRKYDRDTDCYLAKWPD